MIIQFTDGSALETECIAYVTEYIGNPANFIYSIHLKSGFVIEDVYGAIGREDIKGYPRFALINIWRGNTTVLVKFEDLVREKTPDATDDEIKGFLASLKDMPMQISSLEVI